MPSMPDPQAFRAVQAGRCGNDNVVFTKKIEFTDFPMDEVKLNCTGGVIMLPSEY